MGGGGRKRERGEREKEREGERGNVAYIEVLYCVEEQERFWFKKSVRNFSTAVIFRHHLL